MAEIEEILDLFVARQMLEIGQALKDALTQTEFAESQDEVPYEFGDLAGTGVVSEPTIDPGQNKITVTIGYGGGGSKADLDVIAVMQHERSDYYHPGGKKWKYLEDPVTRNAPTLTRRIAERTR